MKCREEILLTRDEIKEIGENAQNRQQLRQPNMINIFGKSHKEIFNISFEKGLILIQGNEHTGYNHISDRHAHFSNEGYWVLDSQKNTQPPKSDNPSKFHPRTYGLLDYVKIADMLYRKEHLDEVNNKRLSEFEKYTAKVTLHGKEEIYNLLVYKDSKIIHTIYPKKSLRKIKRTKGFNFVKGGTSVSQNLMSGEIKIEFPYLDHEKRRRYLIRIVKRRASNQETARIFKYNKDGNEIDSNLTLVRAFEFKGDIAIEQMSYHVTTFFEFEKAILKLEMGGV